MIRIECPVCGLRDETEFTFGGDASRTFPGLEEADLDIWHTYVFERSNPRGAHREFWHHVHGCRQILIVERDTLTHKITSASLASGAKP